MKKALSLVLALAMVLSMAVVGFAADVKGTNYTAKIGDIKVADDGNYYIDIDIDVTTDAVKDVEVTAVDAEGNALLCTEVSELKGTWQVWAATADSIKTFEAAFITIETTDENGAILDQDTYKVTYTAPAVAQQEVIDALEYAYQHHLTAAVIDAANLVDETLTTADWKYITNTYKNGWDNWDHNYLGSEITGVLGNTIYTIGVVDYTWTKDVDFSIYTNVVTEEQYNAIRKLTGDTKNPLVFGFDGMACPDLEVDMVIPQQWINYYGHKNLTLFAWQEAIMAKILNGEDAGKEITVEDAKVLTKTTLDVNTTVTQRIQFETDYLYKVLVLSASGVKDTNNGGSKDDNKDANPNTGANDIVNVAVVFAVVSLAAAGAFVCKKSLRFKKRY